MYIYVYLPNDFYYGTNLEIRKKIKKKSSIEKWSLTLTLTVESMSLKLTLTRQNEQLFFLQF